MKIKNLLAAAFVTLAISSSNGQMITNFGANATNGGTWTYTPGTSTISGTEGFGDLIFGAPLSLDISGATGLSLTANAATAPTGAFFIIIEDSVFAQASAIFTWSDFTGGNTVQATFSTVTPGFNFSNLSGWSLVSGASLQPINVSVNSLSAVAVPEPSSTAALAVLSLLAAVIVHGRRIADTLA